MNEIEYIQEDLLPHTPKGRTFICHCCNDIGLMEEGFAVKLAYKWRQVRVDMLRWKSKNKGLKLGSIQVIKVDTDLYVVNMIGQHDVYEIDGVQPIRYEAIESCLTKVQLLAEKHDAKIIAPKFGTGLAGGDWTKIEEIVNRCLINNGVEVSIYEGQ